MTPSPDIAEAEDDLRSGDPERQARGIRRVEALRGHGDPIAAYAVASWLLSGAHGYPRDPERAAALLQFAADHGVRDAQYDLGVLVEKRRMGAHPRREAFSRYLTATALGDRDAAHELVRCLYYGIGTLANRKGAEQLFEALTADEQRPLAAE